MLEHFDGIAKTEFTGETAAKDRAAALDAVRGRTLAIVTGLIALVAVYYTARNADTARRTFQLGEQGHVTDRYTRAIEQLGNRTSLEIRLGGIYALERIARDSARDHPAIMEVLAAFIREHSHDRAPGFLPDADATTVAAPGAALPPQRKTRTDVQAALTVIGRRILDHDQPGARINLSGADLTSMDLTGATLLGARLTRARLTRTDLTRADLTRADLTRVRDPGPRPEGVVLTDVIGLPASWADPALSIPAGAPADCLSLSEHDSAGPNVAKKDHAQGNLS
ncbi:pentapeptide repeat-containing protein [Planomonospora sp. ID91781]|uniref:pentapeptide repeat-containing protein n=1 Tax=Planomonospora sp. ID91781 TaxID=2738135 RepID=UPI0018C3C53E|nr:pentapeptide repeat-containing protein [Planomonospora sp. ID91781]